MTIDDFIAANAQLYFHNYHKYQFKFSIKCGIYVLVATIGDGSPDDIYRLSVFGDSSIKLNEAEYEHLTLLCDGQIIEERSRDL